MVICTTSELVKSSQLETLPSTISPLGRLMMARVNHQLNPALETFFLPPGEGCESVSSSLVRELASLGGDIGPYVPPQVRDTIIQHYSKGGPSNG